MNQWIAWFIPVIKIHEPIMGIEMVWSDWLSLHEFWHEFCTKKGYLQMFCFPSNIIFFGKHRFLPVILWFLKISFFCISLFASFRFWMLTHFPKAVCPEYSPGGCSDHCFRLIGYSTSLSHAYDTLLKI